jgi:Ion channel
LPTLSSKHIGEKTKMNIFPRYRYTEGLLVSILLIVTFVGGALILCLQAERSVPALITSLCLIIISTPLAIRILIDVASGKDVTPSGINMGILEWIFILIAFIGAIIVSYAGVYRYCGVKDTLIDINHGVTYDALTCLYFSIVTFTTLGYGDVVPTIGIARVFVACEVLTGYIVLGFLITSLMRLLGKSS